MSDPHRCFILLVNIPLIWVMAPLVALVSRRFPLVGLSVYGVIFVNAIVHTVPALLGKGYGPGLLTSCSSCFLFGLVFVALFGPGRRPRRLAIWVVAGGTPAHGVLLDLVWLFVTGRLSAPALSAVQVANAFVIPILLWVASRGIPLPLLSSGCRSWS